MSGLVAIRFVRDFSTYRQGEVVEVSAGEAERLIVGGVARRQVVERQVAVETATAVAPERAVTRSKRR